MSDIAIRVHNLSERGPSTGLRAGRIGAERHRYRRSVKTVMDAIAAPVDAVLLLRITGALFSRRMEKTLAVIM